MRDDTNARAEVVEMRGLLAADLPTGLREMQAIAAQSRSRGNFLYQANINPRAGEVLSAAQWREAADILEKSLGLSGHQRIIVEHEKAGRVHRHCVWNRVDTATLRVADMGGNYRIHAATARELEKRFGLMPTPAQAAPDRPRAPELWEHRAAERSGIDPTALKSELTALWRGADSGQGFAAALAARGYILAKGDRRDFCIVDQSGTAHSLARRLDGVKAAQIREFMGDIDRDSLPTVAEARALQRAAGTKAEAGASRLTATVLKLSCLPPDNRFGARAREVTQQARQRQRERERGRPSGAPVEAKQQDWQPRKISQQNDGAGLYVTVSRKRLDYARPCVQSGANANLSPRWTAARIKGLGEFRALSRLIVMPVVSPRAAVFERPTRSDVVRSAAVEPVKSEANGGEDGADDGLSALLAAIAAEVQGRAAGVRAALSAQFAGGIAHVRKTLPRDQVAGAVAALKQAMAAAMKAVQASAAMEVIGKQKSASVLWRRRHLRSINRLPIEPKY